MCSNRIYTFFLSLPREQRCSRFESDNYQGLKKENMYMVNKRVKRDREKISAVNAYLSTFTASHRGVRTTYLATSWSQNYIFVESELHIRGVRTIHFRASWSQNYIFVESELHIRGVRTTYSWSQNYIFVESELYILRCFYTFVESELHISWSQNYIFVESELHISWSQNYIFVESELHILSEIINRGVRTIYLLKI